MSLTTKQSNTTLRLVVQLEVEQPGEPSTPVIPDAPVTPADPDPGTPAAPEEPATVPAPQEPATPAVPEPAQPDPGQALVNRLAA